jgi:Fe-S cluster biogenesis protein NfuA
MTIVDALSQVQRVLDDLRPAMEADGGGVEVVSISDGRVAVRLLGTCLACPSSELTLKLGIEKTLREHLPWVTALERVA